MSLEWVECKMLAKISTKKLLWALCAAGGPRHLRELSLIALSAKHFEENRNKCPQKNKKDSVLAATQSTSEVIDVYTV